MIVDEPETVVKVNGQTLVVTEEMTVVITSVGLEEAAAGEVEGVEEAGVVSTLLPMTELTGTDVVMTVVELAGQLDTVDGQAVTVMTVSVKSVEVAPAVGEVTVVDKLPLDDDVGTETDEVVAASVVEGVELLGVELAGVELEGVD